MTSGSYFIYFRRWKDWKDYLKDCFFLCHRLHGFFVHHKFCKILFNERGKSEILLYYFHIPTTPYPPSSDCSCWFSKKKEQKRQFYNQLLRGSFCFGPPCIYISNSMSRKFHFQVDSSSSITSLLKWMSIIWNLCILIIYTFIWQQKPHMQTSPSISIMLKFFSWSFVT